MPYPKLEMWIDSATGRPLKRVELAPSGRLMRTVYFTKWEQIAGTHYPGEVRIFDEVQKQNRTTILISGVELNAVKDSFFTKGFIEQHGR